jgi:hypothetical protein
LFFGLIRIAGAPLFVQQTFPFLKARIATISVTARSYTHLLARFLHVCHRNTTTIRNPTMSFQDFHNGAQPKPKQSSSTRINYRTHVGKQTKPSGLLYGKLRLVPSSSYESMKSLEQSSCTSSPSLHDECSSLSSNSSPSQSSPPSSAEAQGRGVPGWRRKNHVGSSPQPWSQIENLVAIGATGIPSRTQPPAQRGSAKFSELSMEIKHFQVRKSVPRW